MNAERLAMTLGCAAVVILAAILAVVAWFIRWGSDPESDEPYMTLQGETGFQSA